MRMKPGYPKPVIVRFNLATCLVVLRRYVSNGRLGLELIDRCTETHLCVATENCSVEKACHDEVFIKNHHENKGMLKALCDAKVVEPCGWIPNPREPPLIKCRLLFSVPHDFWDGTVLVHLPPRKREETLLYYPQMRG